MSVDAQSQTLSFEAEVKQLLGLMAHSLYSNKEIFLRELISNASDAADKLRYEALSDNALYENDATLKIWIDFDKKNKTITIADNGIGMNREEVIENLGTIAKSGTRAFRELLDQKKSEDSQLIGQFGVGFYSTFVIADKVVVRTRRAGMQTNQGVYWESDGAGEFTIKNIEMQKRGTEIVLHVKEDSEEFLDEFRLRSIITKYSDHIVLPIVMKKNEPQEESKSELKLDKEGKTESDEIVIPAEEVVNRASALWTLPKSEIKDQDYIELYKHIAHDFEEPLSWSHNKVEGKQEYISLLYLPARAPFDLWNREMQKGLKLYVKRVFIMDDAEHFMPMYLRFVKGIIDSNDLPLNISREILQSNKIIDTIRSGSVKRVLGLLEKMATDEPDKYLKFWKEFGQVLKEGPAEDFANKDTIAKLLRFSSTHTDSADQAVSLDDYINRMPETQEKVYYIIADNFLAAKNSPLLEVFRTKGVEVLLLSDRVDEWLMGNLREYRGKSFQSVAKGSLDLGKLSGEDNKETQEEQEKQKQDFADLLKSLQESLGEKVKEVRLTDRLTDSPACVVFDENDMGGHLQRLLEAAGQAVPDSKPILELNPKHHLLLKLKSYSLEKTHLEPWAEILLGQALLAEGEKLKDPATFVRRLNELLTQM